MSFDSWMIIILIYLGIGLLCANACIDDQGDEFSFTMFLVWPLAVGFLIAYMIVKLVYGLYRFLVKAIKEVFCL